MGYTTAPLPSPGARLRGAHAGTIINATPAAGGTGGTGGLFAPNGSKGNIDSIV